MSTTTVKTDTMSKVLPGDKSGLPWEIWQMILSYLDEMELCRACCVSKTWNDLVVSLDGTRWKELYLKCEDWKHPYWPLNTHSEPPSWKQAYHNQYLSTRQWYQCSKDMNQGSCLYVLKRKKERKIIRVGPGKEHTSLKSALAIANDFDRIEVYPGIYDEQFEMTSKIPFELVGVGELGSVILVVCIEQTAITGRVSNLVLRAPWFTTFILKIRSGYLQLDNCILEDGMVYAQNPGSCHIRFCTFRHATIIMQHMNVSVVENCEFSQSDTAAVIVEGYSKDEKNWTYSFLCSRIHSIFSQSHHLRRHSDVTMKTTESQVTASSSHLTSSDSTSHDQNSHSGTLFRESVDTTLPKQVNDNITAANNEGASAACESLKNEDQSANLDKCEQCVPISEDGAEHENEAKGNETEAVSDGGLNHEDGNAPQVPPLDLDGGDNRGRPESRHSLHSRLSYESDEDSLSFLDELESGRSSSPEAVPHGSSTSSSDEEEDIERIIHTDSDDDLSSGEESVIMLPHLRQKDPQSFVSAQGVNADIVSISSQCSKPIPINIVNDRLMRSVVNQVQGCLIHQCRMMYSKGGVMISLQAHAVVSECDISNVGYGIRCIQNSRVVVLKNKIHHCRTSGVFMRLASSGLIAGNDIHSNMEAGIDIRKNADPIVQNNRIHHGKRSGIVVLGSGRGQIKKNDLYENREAGIYILYGGNPTVSQNHIYDGKAAGVAVNEHGRGFIFDNVIRGNQWGGVDIRHGGDPLVSGNTISHGIGDGIVIGERGRGAIENNVITGNAGCGIWLMSASHPYLHGNQIHNNGDSGIMFVNKMDVQVHNIPESMNLPSPQLGILESEDGVYLPRCDVATVQYNNVYHNAGKGIVVQQGDEVHVKFNAIHANVSDGIMVHQDRAVVLRSNSVTNNRGAGIVSTSISQDNHVMHIQGNGVYDNRDHGIVCKCRGHIVNNDVTGNQNGAISLDGNALVTVVENRLECPSGPCLKVVGVSQGMVENNVVQEETEPWIRHDAFSERLVLENTILQAQLDPKSSKPVFNKTQFLSNPGPRPEIDPPPASTTLPANNVSAITKVTVPSGEGLEQGSKLCCIL